MRVNPKVFTERSDMFADLRVRNCPDKFKLVAENLLNMVAKPGYSVGDYNKMTELDKILMLDYWRTYDGWTVNFEYVWFVKKATSPELIRRAREFLCSHNYIIVKPDVQQRALEAGINMRNSIRRG